MFDTLITGGTLLLGDGSKPVLGTVGITGDCLTAVGPDVRGEARKVVDAGGLCVAPGFIDIHSHSDLTLMVNPQGHSKLMQGVTTEVVGNCGLTAFPLVDDQRRGSLQFIDVPGMDWTWRTAEGFLNRLSEARPAINTVQLAGHGGLRAAVVGYENRKATAEEIKRMQEMLASLFEEGIWGLSTGLGYAPDFYSDEMELCALAEVVRTYDRVFSLHVRGERATLFKAVAEAIDVSRRTGANVEVSHLKCADSMNRGRMAELLSLFDQAKSEGLPVHFDQYPYTAGNSYLGLVFPPWAHEGGISALLNRLRDAETRVRLEKDMMAGCGEWCSMLSVYQGENIMLTDVGGIAGQALAGKLLSQVACQRGVPVQTAACDVMLEAGGRAEMVMFQQDEADLELAMRHPLGMFGSDGFAMDQGEKIAKGTPHPRSFGTFARVYAEYVRKRGVLTLEEAVRRMTGASAQKLRLKDRGLLKTGMKADVTVFSAQSILDLATYEQPKVYAQGVEWVFVGGVAEKTPDGLTGARNGRVLRREKA